MAYDNGSKNSRLVYSTESGRVEKSGGKNKAEKEEKNIRASAIQERRQYSCAPGSKRARR